LRLLGQRQEHEGEVEVLTKRLAAGAQERQELLDQIAELTAGSGRVLRFFY